MFSAEPVVQWPTDLPGRVKLLNELTFTDPAGREWHAPVGLVSDGASIPEVLWSIMGNPFAGRYRRAALFHDEACRNREASAKDSHRMFYDAMIADGVELEVAQRFYAAVRLFGPSWPDPRRRAMSLMNLPPTIDEIEVALDTIVNE